MKLRTSAAIIALVALSGCATIFGNDSDQLMIHSKYPDAKILVNGNEVGRGSATYTLQRGNDATIVSSRKGCTDASVPVGRTVVGAAFLNVFFWPGFIVDAATGKIQKADPLDYSVTPSCT